MSKYKSKASELLGRVQSLIDSFVIEKVTNGWPDDYVASKTITEQYPDILLDVQSLFFCDAPESPFYNRAMKLNERLDDVQSRVGVYFRYTDFIGLQELLSKYLEYREFLEADD